ncbi:MAG: hypothetical protein H6837_15565 [Planctomycetes bacterium]|nr:hypothetical protein [Planctomycetota bacterium]
MSWKCAPQKGGKENGRFCPEAGCLPVEEEVLTFDEASSDLARSQQLSHE